MTSLADNQSKTAVPTGTPLEWTGERYLPWIPDPPIAYEHLQRYAFAARLAEGKQVLDLASGEGYGSNILAAVARKVVGIDIDENAVRHAQHRYSRSNLEFVSASVASLPLHPEHAFDLVVCFEAIEHIEGQQELVSEARRMLTADGVFVVSTPNKHRDEDGPCEENPFHVRELDFDEFRTLLSNYFTNVCFFGQRIYGNSNLWPLGTAAGAVDELVIARGIEQFEFVSSDRREATYFIAIASNGPLPKTLSGSVLIDASDQLLKQNRREVRELLQTKEANEEAIAWLHSQVESLSLSVKALNEGVEWYQGQIQGLTEGHAWKDKLIADARATITAQEEGIAWLQDVVQDLRQNLENENRKVQALARQLELVHASRGWRLILRLRRIRDWLTHPKMMAGRG